MASVQLHRRDGRNSRLICLGYKLYGMRLDRHLLPDRFLVAKLGWAKSEAGDADSRITRHVVVVKSMRPSVMENVFGERTGAIETTLRTFPIPEPSDRNCRVLEMQHFAGMDMMDELEDLLVGSYENTILGRLLRKGRKGR